MPVSHTPRSLRSKRSVPSIDGSVSRGRKKVKSSPVSALGDGSPVVSGLSPVVSPFPEYFCAAASGDPEATEEAGPASPGALPALLDLAATQPLPQETQDAHEEDVSRDVSLDVLHSDVMKSDTSCQVACLKSTPSLYGPLGSRLVPHLELLAESEASLILAKSRVQSVRSRLKAEVSSVIEEVDKVETLFESTVSSLGRPLLSGDELAMYRRVREFSGLWVGSGSSSKKSKTKTPKNKDVDAHKSFVPKTLSKSDALSIPSSVLSSGLEKARGLVDSFEGPVFSPRPCGCSVCKSSPGHHPDNVSARQVFLFFGIQDCFEKTLVSDAFVVEHFNDSMKKSNGPETLGCFPGGTKRPLFPGSSKTKTYTSGMEAVLHRLGCAPNSNWPLLQASNDDDALVRLQSEFAENPSAELEKSIVSRLKELAKEEGYLNQWVVLQKFDGDDIAVEHPLVVLVPAACYYDGFVQDVLTDPLFEGFKKSCVLANRERLSRKLCCSLFGPHGADNVKGPEDYQVEEHNGKKYYVSSKLWYPELRDSK